MPSWPAPAPLARLPGPPPTLPPRPRRAAAPLPSQRLVCGDSNGLEVPAWRAAVRVEGSQGAPGRLTAAEQQAVGWFWDAVEGMASDEQRRLLQFWSGSDSVPLEARGAPARPGAGRGGREVARAGVSERQLCRGAWMGLCKICPCFVPPEPHPACLCNPQGLASLDPPFLLSVIPRGERGGSGGGGGADHGAARSGGSSSSGASTRPARDADGGVRGRHRRAWAAAVSRLVGRGARGRAPGHDAASGGSVSADEQEEALAGLSGDDEALSPRDADGAGGPSRPAAPAREPAGLRRAGHGGGGGGGPRLPSAHTCGRMLQLPLYDSPQELRERLHVVLRWAREGMGLA
jgi:hypothetical protein